MKKYKLNLYNTIFNPYLMQFFFLFFTLLLETPLLLPILNPLMKLSLIWAAAFLIYDVFNDRLFLKGKNKWLLILFLVSYGITVLSTYQNKNFKMNMISYFYIVVQLLIMTIPQAEGTLSEKIYHFGQRAIKFSIVISLIGFVMFITQYFDRLIYSNKDYVLGFYNGRLVGAYRGLTSATLAIMFMISLFVFSFNWIRNRKFDKVSFLGVIINFIHLGLSNSKGVLYGLLFSSFVFIFFTILYIGKEMEIKKIFQSVFLTIVILAISSQIMTFTSSAMSYGPYFYDQNYVFESEVVENEDFKPIEGPISLEREIPDEYDKLTGRPLLWKMGLEAFSEKPLLGHGAYSKAGEIQFDFSNQKFTHYHSSYIHTLFSSGLLGSVPLFLFLISIAVKTIAFLFTKQDHNNYLIVLFLSSILAYFALTAVAQTNLLYFNRFPEYFFWISVGTVNSIVASERKE